MVTIVNYRERYQSDLEKLQPEMARELRMHPDVVRETACVALSDGVFIGAGFLAEANPYRVDAGDEQVRYLRAEFAVLQGCDEEAEASILLLEELQYRFDRLRATDGRKPVMRVWVKSEDTAYTELLFDEGFRVGNVMTVMARDIDETDEWLEDEIAEVLAEENRGPAYEPLLADDADLASQAETDIELREFYDSESEWRQYFAANARSFGEPDSENEMRFRLKNPNAHVWVAIADDRLVAAASTWPVADGVYATENIFCDPDYRRKGITTRLLKYVFGKLYDAEARCARLTVYGDNLPAIRLYRKLEYSVAYELLEMHYYGKADRRENEDEDI